MSTAGEVPELIQGGMGVGIFCSAADVVEFLLGARRTATALEPAAAVPA